MTPFRHVLIVLSLAPAVLLVPTDAWWSCDVIPGATNSLRSALGSVNRPFAIPGDDGQQIAINLGPCDSTSLGFPDLGLGPGREGDYYVTVLFEPPSGKA